MTLPSFFPCGRESIHKSSAARIPGASPTDSRLRGNDGVVQRLKGQGADASRPCMSVDTNTVRKIASLARIAVTDDEVGAMTGELNNILGWVEQLGEVDTDGVEPLAAVIPNQLRLRDDVITDGEIRDQVLANAPQAEHGFFAVPKVIE
jgi:aspartyl-tRNA(Asn)/glutamyl-tRNA(Gln) amidotransferase subunit C